MQTNNVAPLRAKEMDSLIPMVEAILFVRSMGSEELARITGYSVELVELALDAYGDYSNGLKISSIAGKYYLEPKSDFAEILEEANKASNEQNSQILDEYLHSLSISGRRKSTIKMRLGFLSRFLLEIKKPFQEISTRDIRAFLMAEEKSGNCRNTLATKTAILQAFFKWLEKEELIDKNPMNKIDKPKVGQSDPKFLTHEEIEQVRDACKNLREKAIFELLYSSGARVSEALALNKDDIDWQAKKICIHDGKGGKPRLAPLSTKALRTLEQYIKNRKDDGRWLLHSQFNKRLSKESIERSIKILGKRAGLQKRLTPHRLRHSLATHLLVAETPIDVVQTILGHTDISTTQIYAKTQESSIEHHYRRVFP